MRPGPCEQNPRGDPGADTLGLTEIRTHHFIVKVWIEETAEEAGQAVWRGHITHVPSGRRRYLRDFGDIIAFIEPYLEAMGVRGPGGEPPNDRDGM